MTAVWILLFVCTSSLPSCSQGDVSVANQSYTSSEECYADGAMGRVIICIEGRQEQKVNKCPFEIRYDAVPACAQRPAGYAKATWRPATKAIWSVVNLRFGRSLR